MNDPDLRQKVEAKLDEILTALPAHELVTSPLSLMGGQAGSILFYFFLAKMRDSAILYDQAYTLLMSVFDKLEKDGVNHLSYCNGLTGFGLLFKLLADQQLIDTDPAETLAEFDELIVHYIYQLLKENNLDYLHGAIGGGLYLLARWGNPIIDQCLLHLLAHLEDTALEDEQGVRWVDSPAGFNQQRSGRINLSLSHGLASKIIFLAKCSEAQIDMVKVHRLLRGAVHFLLSQQDPNGTINQFPATVEIKGQKTFTHRLAWCYGDLGTAVALVYAGKAAGQPTWVKAGITLAERATRRTSYDETHLLDTEICHGTAGVAHIFNRFYYETGYGVFQIACEHWIRETLAKATFSDGIAGYKTSRAGIWHSDVTLLEGTTGVGLVLQSYLEPNNANFEWDSVFLLNWPH